MSDDEGDTAKSLGEICAVVADQLTARHPELTDAIYARIQEVVPIPGGSDSSEAQAAHATIAAVVDYCLEGIKGGPKWSGSIPPEAAAQARRAARFGVSVGTILRGYVTGHGRLGEFIAGEVERGGSSDKVATHQHLRRTQERLLERLTAVVELEYVQELARVGRSHFRSNIVMKLLSGDPVDEAELVELDYELNASWHIGLVATGANADKALRALNARLGRELLLVSGEGQAVWAWLGGVRKITVADIERVLSHSAVPAVSLAVGEPARGIDGWRQTHRSARLADLVARSRRGKITRYLDVALEASLLQDAALADVFIDGYLSPLDGERGGGLGRRRTLRAIFDAEHNVSSAASRLNVDRSSVRRWLADIERRLGYRVHERQAEIEIALRLEEIRGYRHANGTHSTDSHRVD